VQKICDLSQLNNRPFGFPPRVQQRCGPFGLKMGFVLYNPEKYGRAGRIIMNNCRRKRSGWRVLGFSFVLFVGNSRRKVGSYWKKTFKAFSNPKRAWPFGHATRKARCGQAKPPLALSGFLGFDQRHIGLFEAPSPSSLRSRRHVAIRPTSCICGTLYKIGITQ